MENTEAEKKRERKVMDHEGRYRELSDLLEQNNIHNIGVPEDEERQMGAEVYSNGKNMHTSILYPQRLSFRIQIVSQTSKN